MILKVVSKNKDIIQLPMSRGFFLEIPYMYSVTNVINMFGEVTGILKVAEPLIETDIFTKGFIIKKIHEREDSLELSIP